MKPGDPIYVAGHLGMVGAAIVRLLRARGFKNLILRGRAELDLTDRAAVRAFYAETRPSYVFVAAAKVGGIWANTTQPVEFLSENLQIELNLIDGAHTAGVAKLLFLGSSCIYPKFAPQPITEDALLTGLLEPTNEPYALAKICGIKLCQAYHRQHGSNFISAMPTNIYGPEDNFDLQTSHVLPALIHRFHVAHQTSQPTLAIWGTGGVYREFLHVDDLAEACLFLMQQPEYTEFVNIGWGRDILIRDLAALVAKVVGYQGKIEWDTTKPDGTPRKLLDVTRLTRLGWTPRIELEPGLRETYRWWVEHP